MTNPVTSPDISPSQQTPHTVDVVVVGSGSAGMTAAVVSALQGLDVLLVEKTPYFGGATAWSGGGLWIPDNRHMREAGMTDSLAAAETYIRAVVGENLDEKVLATYLANCQPMLDYMEANTAVRYDLKGTMPDYFPDLPGGTNQGRLLNPTEYDGRLLGDWFSKLRPALEEFNAPYGMMVDLVDAYHMMAATKSWGSFVYTLKMGLRYGADRLRGYPRGTRLTMGNALSARLLRSAIDAGVSLWNNCAATGLVHEGKRITGIDLMKEGKAIRVMARRGIVLASGGFSSNPEMRAKYIPFAEHHQSLMPEGNTGDGLKMATALGAKMQDKNPSNAVWNIISLHHRPDGSIQKFPHLFLDKPKPGCIAINQQGKRFGNEASLVFTEDMHKTGSVPAWLMCDDKFIHKFGLGLVYPGGFGLRKLLRHGYLIKAQTLAELAQKMGVPEDALQDTVATFNGYAANGKDPEFGRGDSFFDIAGGDPEHKPNPSLGPINNAPFYAVKIFPGDATTTVGLKTDGNCQVLDTEGNAIAGLFACGLDMNSLWAGLPPFAGSNHTLNLTLGYVIANTLVRSEPDQPE